MKQIIKELIQVVNIEDNWEKAIKVAFEPLVLNNYCKASYVKQAIENVKTLGDYIVLFEGVAFPHAAPKFGSLKTGYCITIFKNPITFPTKGKVKHFIAFVSTANNGHIEMLKKFSMLFFQKEQQLIFKNTTSVNEVLMFWNGDTYA